MAVLFVQLYIQKVVRELVGGRVMTGESGSTALLDESLNVEGH